MVSLGSAARAGLFVAAFGLALALGGTAVAQGATTGKAGDAQGRATQSQQSAAQRPSANGNTRVEPPAAQKQPKATSKAGETKAKEQPSGMPGAITWVGQWIADPDNFSDFLIMLFTAALTVVAFMQHSLETKLAADNSEAMCIASKSAKAAADTAKALVDGERPWLSLNDVTMVGLGELTKDGMVPIPYAFGEMTNTGRTPAFVTRYSERLHTVARLEDLPALPDYGTPSDIANFIVVPGASWRITTTLEELVLGAGEIEMMKWRRSFLVLYGFVEYRDTFGSTHTTKFFREWHEPSQPGMEKTRGFRFGGPRSYHEHT